MPVYQSINSTMQPSWDVVFSAFHNSQQAPQWITRANCKGQPNKQSHIQSLRAPYSVHAQRPRCQSVLTHTLPMDPWPAWTKAMRKHAVSNPGFTRSGTTTTSTFMIREQTHLAISVQISS